MDDSPWGGSEELWYKVANEAIEKSHRISVCVKYWPDEVDKIKILKGKGAGVIYRKPYTRPRRLIRVLSFGIYRKTADYFGELQKCKADAILISQGDTFSFFNDNKLFEFVTQLNKPFYLISQFNAESGGVVPQEIKNKIGAFRHKWENFYFVSERNLRSAERQVAGDLGNTLVINNPIKINKVSICSWPHIYTSHRLACVARYECSFKGQDILIQTLAEPEFENLDFILNFYGKGPDENHLQQLIGYYNLGKKVFICKFLDNIDLLWETHHVLVLPSIAEGTPLALQEAMLKGRPALVTDVGGNSSLIVDNETGFLAATASVNSLKVKLLQLFSTPLAQLEQMGKKAFEKATQEIDLKASSKILLELESKVSI